MFYEGKRVLVTGGSGFVGRHIISELLKYDLRVRVPIHKTPLFVKDARIETIAADLTRQEDCLRVSEGVDYIFHAAGAVAAAGVTAANPMSAIATNLILTAQMLEAAWRAGVDRFLIFSSSTAYPAANYPIKEEEMWSAEPYPAYFGYGWMRRYLEKMGEFVAMKSKTRIALIRPTAVYGRWDNFDLKTGHVVPALIRRAVEKENPFVVWGTGSEIRDFLHVSDLARGCLLMLEKCATCNPVNIGSGKGVMIKEVVSQILKSAGHDKAEVVFDATKPTTIPFRMVDTAKSKEILGFEPEVALNEGLADTVSWYEGKQDIKEQAWE